MSKTAPITSFTGEFRFLSNFYPVIIKLDERCYRTVEHAYQASKTLHSQERRIVELANTPYLAKGIGNSLTLRDNWDTCKVEIMYGLLRQKFDNKYNTNLADKLLSTEDAVLIEGNTWGDRFWGQCPIGIGQNELGKLLMSIRNDLIDLRKNT